MNTPFEQFGTAVAVAAEQLFPLYDAAIADAQDRLSRAVSITERDTIEAELDVLRDCEPRLRIPVKDQHTNERAFANPGETLTINGVTFEGTPAGQPQPTVTKLGAMGCALLVCQPEMIRALDSGRLIQVQPDGHLFYARSQAMGCL